MEFVRIERKKFNRLKRRYMQISISNVIINYFLTHPEVQVLDRITLSSLVNKIQDAFAVRVTDFSYYGLKETVEIFNDFLSLDNDCSIIQKNILDYLDDLEPVYEYLSFNQWNKQYQYYKLIRQF